MCAAAVRLEYTQSCAHTHMNMQVSRLHRERGGGRDRGGQVYTCVVLCHMDVQRAGRQAHNDHATCHVQYCMSWETFQQHKSQVCLPPFLPPPISLPGGSLLKIFHSLSIDERFKNKLIILGFTLERMDSHY